MGIAISRQINGTTYNFIDDPLVSMEVEGKTGVVFLDENTGSSFGGFGTNTALLKNVEQ